MMLKTGVRVLGIRPEIVLALIILQEVWAVRNQALVVTSVIDGVHSQGSLHYAGCAVDLRLPTQDAGTLVAEARQRLGGDFDVVLESDHVHVEYQPKQAY